MGAVDVVVMAKLTGWIDMARRLESYNIISSISIGAIYIHSSFMVYSVLLFSTLCSLLRIRFISDFPRILSNHNPAIVIQAAAGKNQLRVMDVC